MPRSHSAVRFGLRLWNFDTLPLGVNCTELIAIVGRSVCTGPEHGEIYSNRPHVHD